LLLCGNPKKGIFTDKANSPSKIAGFLRDNGAGDARLCVFENMGSENETIQWITPDMAASKTFSEPNFLVIKKETAREPAICCDYKPYSGMPERDFFHKNGLITKSEVRVVSLARLRLFDGCTVWDIGAGSGSVSIEASVVNKQGRLIAVEKEPERIGDIKKNKEKFGVLNLEVVEGEFQKVYQKLPKPDRVFIGGGGKDLGEIIKKTAALIKHKGIVVINTVLLSNLHIAVETLERSGFETEVSQIQVSREQKMPWDKMLKAFNPVWIITGGLKN
jgi:precorrin-6Y C5,15-methyltransferase (decarboxylating)